MRSCSSWSTCSSGRSPSSRKRWPSFSQAGQELGELLDATVVRWVREAREAEEAAVGAAQGQAARHAWYEPGAGGRSGRQAGRVPAGVRRLSTAAAEGVGGVHPAAVSRHPADVCAGYRDTLASGAMRLRDGHRGAGVGRDSGMPRGAFDSSHLRAMKGGPATGPVPCGPGQNRQQAPPDRRWPRHPAGRDHHRRQTQRRHPAAPADPRHPASARGLRGQPRRRPRHLYAAL